MKTCLRLALPLLLLAINSPFTQAQYFPGNFQSGYTSHLPNPFFRSDDVPNYHFTPQNPTLQQGGYTTPSQDDFLGPHNAARADVGVSPLSWDNDIAAYARRYANFRRQDCLLAHSNSRDDGLGENLYVSSSSDTSAKEAVEAWVSQRRYYDYYTNSCVGGQCLHYKQVVWSGTTRVGCARVVCNGGGVFVTCNYSPPGNIDGQRPY